MTDERFARIREVLDHRQPDLTVLMDNVHKPHNLSAITRTCDAVGIGDVHSVRTEASLRVWRRGASGTQRWVVQHAHRDAETACAALSAQGMTLAIADFGPDARDYRDIDYTVPLALIVGAELDGLSEAARERADVRLTIPMSGMAQSLNVSVAVALVLFEARTQRERAGLYDQPRLTPEHYTRLAFEWRHPQIAAHCQRLNLAYPDMDDGGDIIGEFARGQ